jgi:hypothetical protein
LVVPFHCGPHLRYVVVHTEARALQRAEQEYVVKVYKALIFAAMFGRALTLSPCVKAAPPRDVQFLTGTCEPSSHTAEGPLGSDLTKRQSRFFCDSAVIAFFDDYKGHVMIQFVQKQAHHTPILGFAGKVEDDGIIMKIDHVYLKEGQATTVSDGLCKFFLKNRQMSGIFCGMMVDETGRRTTAVVAFKPATG